MRLAAVAVFTAMVWASGASAAGRCSGVPPYLSSAVSSLPPEKAKTVREALRAVVAKQSADCATLSTLRGEMSALLTAPKFDRAAYVSKISAIQQLKAKNMTALNETFAEQVEKLSVEERKSLDAAMRAGKARKKDDAATPAAAADKAPPAAVKH
ncbi:periplasmic heavy metal sensor [bacterium]|nr:periplasmic heavy metal sensor [bacterium]